MSRVWILVAALVLGCRPSAQPAASAPVSVERAEPLAEADPHSAADPSRVRVRHLGADWTVDFRAHRLRGAVTVEVERADPSAPLRLDTRALDIQAVMVGARVAGERPGRLAELHTQWSPTRWSLAEEDPITGSALEIELPAEVDLVRIEYATTERSTGLQWLSPEQTASGTHPFLYSQSQAIHARSWIPCQDTPGVRVTYDAVVRAGDGLVPLMSAERVDSSSEDGQRFVMPQPVPSYLIALAVGNLEFRALGERAGVWAEPPVVARAAEEFADVERMISTAESLYGPYRWERYDILVLPPAFPFGGMENPRLTFATPTILAGDRSLVALVAHELAHSWSGNLVTNSAWSDIWLNEGFTVYIERRIVEALYGVQRAQMEASLGQQDLARALTELSDADQRLVVDLRGRDPDDGLNDIPYEKGALFLETLERAYGRGEFDRFLRAWFDQHAFTSVDTGEFERFAEAELIGPASPGVSRPDLDAWIRKPGIGPGAPIERGDPFAGVDAVVAEFRGGAEPGQLDVAKFTPHEWLRFLRAIESATEADRLAALDRAYDLTGSRNSEIVAQWLQVAILNGYRATDPRLEEFLLSVGRRKFLMPLYRRLLEVDRRTDALAIYRRARSGYHPITQQSLDDLLAV